MAIRFFNVKTKEVRVAGLDAVTADPQISAFYNSSDLNVNAHQGQDMGWRLAPEVVVEMNEIKQDELMLERIANRLKKPLEEINDIDILHYISAKTPLSKAPAASDADFTKEYLAEIEALEQKREAARVPLSEMDKMERELGNNPAEVTTTTTESLADMEKRAELEERIAKAKREQAAATEPDTSTTTTTTEARPSTTTTTTKSK